MIPATKKGRYLYFVISLPRLDTENPDVISESVLQSVFANNRVCDNFAYSEIFKRSAYCKK